MDLLQPTAAPAADFGGRLQDSVAQLGTLVPNLLAALVILFAGYLLAKLIQRGVHRVLVRVRLNDALARGGVTTAVERSGAGVNPARLLANLVFWCVMFAVLLVAANALGLKSLADVFAELVGYIPSVIAAVVIVIAGILLGGFVEGLIRASAGTIHGGPTLARVARVGVVVIAVFMALQELGVATEIVTTAFAILFGAVALALALSFGLGNRELAGEVTREWYVRYRAERAAIDREQALEAAEDEAELARPVAFRRAPRGGAAPAAAPPNVSPTAPE
ncbi:hypothetical protein tb265_30250 [Gemmatimonadetes bacterium T265]|nr:hypothetical protein tb265_30250 [Gemmatimonadetes bacterium T265]